MPAIAALFLIAAIAAPSARAAPSASTTAAVDAALARAREAKLHDDPEWRRLLHYRWTPWLGLRSDADYMPFFFSEKGRTDPKAELEATIEAMADPSAKRAYVPFADVGVDTLPAEVRHPQCVFPARYEYLKKKAGLAPAQEFPCTRFNEWRARLDVESVTLVYASAYLGNPASSFGHTFLRLNTGRGGHRPLNGADRSRELLDYGVSYAAAMRLDHVGVGTAALGIIGAVHGSYSLLPYHVKVQEYAQGEQRDLWEYDLTLTPEEVNRLVTHLWELNLYAADYYFFRRNCSYELLTLIEFARPGLDLTSTLPPYVIPTETLRRVTQTPALTGNLRYRASTASRILQRRHAMTPAENALLGRMLRERSLAPLEEIEALDPALARESGVAPPDAAAPARKAALLETAAETLEHRKKTSGNKLSAEDEAFLRATLLARSHLNAKAPPPFDAPVTPRPDLGHEIFRLGAGAGVSEGYGAFTHLDIRPAFHDLLALQTGYDRHFELEFPRVRLRYYTDREEFRLERFDMANVMSLSPQGAVIPGKTWRGGCGVETRRDIDCGHCNQGYVRVGRGLAWELWFTPHAYVSPYVFGDWNVNVSGRYRHGLRAGPDVAAGFYLDIGRAVRLNAQASYSWMPLGDTDFSLKDLTADRTHFFEGKVGLNLALLPDWELRGEMGIFESQLEGLGALAVYF